MTRICMECGRQRNRCKPVVRHIDGRISFACPQCWNAYEYPPFFHRPECIDPHCQNFSSYRWKG